jgi:hypothetical protein
VQVITDYFGCFLKINVLQTITFDSKSIIVKFRHKISSELDECSFPRGPVRSDTIHVCRRYGTAEILRSDQYLESLSVLVFLYSQPTNRWLQTNQTRSARKWDPEKEIRQGRKENRYRRGDISKVRRERAHQVAHTEPTVGRGIVARPLGRVLLQNQQESDRCNPYRLRFQRRI